MSIRDELTRPTQSESVASIIWAGRQLREINRPDIKAVKTPLDQPPEIVNVLGIPEGSEMLFWAIMGSHAYGLNHTDSDTDYVGVFGVPTRHLLGLNPSHVGPRATVTRRNPDTAAHEVGKYLHLALKCNPSMIELLWRDEVKFMDVWFAVLRGNRHRFLSRQLVQDAYMGYASAQLGRMRTAERAPDISATKRRTRSVKHGRHVLRLMEQGFSLYTTGTMDLEVSEAIKTYEYSLGYIESKVNQYATAFRTASSVLPDRPDVAWVNEFITHYRVAHLA